MDKPDTVHDRQLRPRNPSSEANVLPIKRSTTRVEQSVCPKFLLFIKGGPCGAALGECTLTLKEMSSPDGQISGVRGQVHRLRFGRGCSVLTPSTSTRAISPRLGGKLAHRRHVIIDGCPLDAT